MTSRIHPIDRAVGARMRLARIARGLTQSQVGKILGVTFQQVQKYENGTNRISAARLLLISQGLGVRVSAFYDDENPSFNAVAETPFSDIDFELVGLIAKLRDPAVKRELLALIKAMCKVPRAVEHAVATPDANVDPSV